MTTLISQLDARTDQLGNKAAYYVRSATGSWGPTSWQTYQGQTRAAGRAFIALGLKPGSYVCILSNNRPEWSIAFLGALQAGCAATGIYQTSSGPEISFIAEDCKAPVIFVETSDQLRKVQEQKAAGRMPALEHIVLLQEEVPEGVLSWRAFMQKATDDHEAERVARVAALTGGDIASLIYTSGTTGNPKAVMLSHDNLIWTVDTVVALAGVRQPDRIVSYLPLSHVVEQLFTIHGPLASGHQIYYSRGMEHLLEDFKEVRPTWIFGVPRVWEKVYEGVSAKLSAAPPVRQALASWAFAQGRKHIHAAHQGRQLGGLDALMFKLADKVVLSKARAALGFDAARGGISGAAPVSAKVLEFFAGLGFPIHEAYGQSEDCGPTTFNKPGDTRIGSVGKAMPGCEVKLADDGELIVRGPHVFQGYLNRPDATAETMDGEWLLTGDLGRIDEDGFVYIVGRKKEIIITAGGKNIAPRPIEEALTAHPMISQAMLIGDERKFCSALLTLETEAVEAKYGTSPDMAAVEQELQAFIDSEVNPQFARVEHVRKFTVLDKHFSVETGELTATLKLKRRVVLDKFAEQIESMYR